MQYNIFMRNSEIFIDFLNNELSNRGLSKADFSKLSGISQSQISRVLGGKNSPGMGFIQSASDALNLPREFLLEKAGIIQTKQIGSRLEAELIELLSKVNEQEFELILDFVRLLVKRK